MSKVCILHRTIERRLSPETRLMRNTNGYLHIEMKNSDKTINLRNNSRFYTEV